MHSPYQPINCDLHDYLEIACMHHYRLNIELNDGQHFVATAITTRTASSKEEFLLLQNENQQFEIRLDKLRVITPLNKNASFGCITF
ncbi:Rho-binding antiterminator [Buttiauxella gaviniae]|uniref:Rho-binding antiterminator n=1 Tax=Buttiauxella gaviniae TaxID=82990 RepID=A0ABV3NZ45_9ENTR